MKGFKEKWDKMFMAITFAEAGEFEIARQIMSVRQAHDKGSEEKAVGKDKAVSDMSGEELAISALKR